MPKYKHGKITESLTFHDIQEKVAAAKSRMNREALAYFWLLYYLGCRISELYERLIEDCFVTETHFILDIGQRKKGSAETDPLELPLWFPGMDVVCEQLEKARGKRKSKKLIERTVKGVRSAERLRARWLFPHVAATWAQVIVKEILGSQYYPHFLRLNRITEMCSDKDVSLTRLKSFTGIKSLDALQSYMGVAEKEQDAAVDHMAKQIKESQQKDPDRNARAKMEKREGGASLAH